MLCTIYSASFLGAVNAHSLLQRAPRGILRCSRICYRHRTYSAKSDRYETMSGNGRHADDLKWAAGWVVLTAPLKLGTYIRTKGCFVCIDATVCNRILHRHVASRTLCLYHTFRCQRRRRHKTIALINIWNFAGNTYLPICT